MSSYLDNMTDQLQIASIMGKPDSRSTVIFVGPPRHSQMQEDTREIFPLGLLTSMNTQDTRNNIVQEVVGMSQDVPYGYQKGRKVGIMTGLVLFMEEAMKNPEAATEGDVITHFIKALYKSLRESHPGLVKAFYKSQNTPLAETFFEPIAFNDNDKWRNFSSPFFNIPVGLYKLERSEGQKVLEATYFENVRFEGTMNAQVTTSQGGPQFEQMAFSYGRAVPMDPSVEALASYVGGASESPGDVTQYIEELKSYLGVS